MEGFPNTEMVDFEVAQGAPWLPEERLTRAGAKYIPGRRKAQGCCRRRRQPDYRAERGIREANRARHHQSGQCGCAQVKMQSARPAKGGFVVASQVFGAWPPKIQAPSPLPTNSACAAFLRTPGFNQLYLSRATSISTLPVEAGSKRPSRPRWHSDLQAALLQDQGPETRAAVATSIRRALQPHQAPIKQVALAGAIWLVTANNAYAGPTDTEGRF